MREILAFREEAGSDLGDPASAGSLTVEAAIHSRDPAQHIVIGRQESGAIDYLDPRFLSTCMVGSLRSQCHGTKLRRV